ncbi:hypothetical protein [Mycolicibacterium fortuitum]|uniref:hypothetical protein n=1 Tax=Mycolicibacterium fortuitum TaxID=1766 RepID=UPI001042513D|nr:hypothetical protein [Mycolicibacterium fortuitum]
MNFFYHPRPSPITIESSHSDFSKLTYGEQIDRCEPYIEDKLTSWRDQWRTDLQDLKISVQPSPIITALPNESQPSGQAIVNSWSAVVNYAMNHAQPDVGKNLLLCVIPPPTSLGAAGETQDLQRLVARGNATPVGDMIVSHESGIYINGRFADRTAEGRPSKVVEVRMEPAHSPDAGKPQQYGFTKMTGLNGNRLWAVTALLITGDPAWVNDLEHFVK